MIKHSLSAITNITNSQIATQMHKFKIICEFVIKFVYL